MKRFFVRSIHFYQGVSRYLFPRACRFYPSCSEYAIESIQRYGVVEGVFKAFTRILKCSPFSPGGHDPVK